MERIREGDETRAKAAPLQALGDHTCNNATNRFEDEDDDEYENETLMSVLLLLGSGVLQEPRIQFLILVGIEDPMVAPG
jgi:hypothetical protein